MPWLLMFLIGEQRKAKPIFFVEFFLFSGLSGLMPIGATPSTFRSGPASLTLHACLIHPGVSALGPDYSAAKQRMYVLRSTVDMVKEMKRHRGKSDDREW